MGGMQNRRLTVCVVAWMAFSSCSADVHQEERTASTAPDAGPICDMEGGACPLPGGWNGTCHDGACCWSCAAHQPGGSECPFRLDDGSVVTGVCDGEACSYGAAVHPSLCAE